MSNTFAWPTWTPKQAAFIAQRAKYPAMWGGWGAAKSWALCMRTLLLCFKSDIYSPVKGQALDLCGNRGLLGRWEAKDLKETTLKDLFELLPDSLIEGYNRQEGQLRLKGGSELLIPHYKDFKVGGNFCFAAIDQCEEVEQAVIEKLMGRVRMSHTTKGVAIPPWCRSVFAVGNPNGKSYHFKTWELNRRRGKKKDPGFDERFWSINTTTYDNADNLPEDYIPNLERTLTPKKLRIYVGGSWEAFEGQVYDEWSDDLCTNEVDEVPDSSWKKYIGIDHGYPSAKVASFIGLSSMRDGLLYDEVYMEDAKISEFVEAVKAKLILHEREQAEIEHRRPEGLEKIWLWCADPSMRRRAGITLKNGQINEDASLSEAKLYAQEAHRQGFNMPLFMANNEVFAGNDKLNWLFWNNQPARIHLPKLRVNPRAVNHREQFESYHYNAKTGKVAEGQPDHSCDSTRYVISTIFQGDHVKMKDRKKEMSEVEEIISQMQAMKTPEDVSVFAHESGWVA